MTVTTIEARVEDDAIAAEITIAASPETVFRALTDPRELEAWWGSEETYRVERWRSDLTEGGRWRSEGTGSDGEPFVVEGRFVTIEPPRRLVYTWEPSWSDGPTTTVRFDLHPAAGGSTRLVVRHDGFVPGGEAQESHRSGWPLVLSWLRAHAEAPDG